MIFIEVFFAMWSFYLMCGYIGPLPSRGRGYYCTFVMHLDKKISDVFISKCKIAELTFIPHIIPNSVEPFKSSYTFLCDKSGFLQQSDEVRYLVVI